MKGFLCSAVLLGFGAAVAIGEPCDGIVFADESYPGPDDPPFPGLAQDARWIWYPGDYGLWWGNELQSQRLQWGARLPPFWPMYEPHTRAQESEEIPGTGMGLTIVRTLVTRMGGTIDVRSRWGEGTCFTVRIPEKA